MGKIKNYMLALYGSVIIGLGAAGYFGNEVYKNIAKEEEITKKDLNISFGGLGLSTACLIFGTVGATRDFEKQNDLEKELNSKENF